MTFTLGIIFAFIAMFAWGANKIFNKKVLEKIEPYTTTLLAEIIFLFTIAVTALILAIFKKNFILPGYLDLLYIAAVGCIGALGIYFFNKSLEEGMVSIAVPVSSSYLVWTLIFSYFLFGERLSLLQYAAAGIILLGVFIVSIDFSKLKKKHAEKLKKGVKYALITALMWGIYFTATKIPIKKFGGINATLFLATASLIFLSLPLILRKRKLELSKINKRIWILIILAGSIMAIGDIMNNLAVGFENVSLIIPITASSALVSVILAAIFLKEKLKANEIIGIIATTIGILLISI